MASEAPDVQEGTLQANTGEPIQVHSVQLVLNELESPAEDITLEVDSPELDDEHFSVYAVNGVNLTVTRDGDDVEGPNGSNLGINTTWTAGGAVAGTLQFRLIHEPEP